LDTSRDAHKQAVHENLTCYDDLNACLKQKVQDSHRLINGLNKRTESLAASIAHMQKSLESLQAAHAAKEPSLQRCQWRLGQRERRPLRESVRDQVEFTLEQEKEVLVETQRKLTEAMKRTKAMIAELHAKLAEVQSDLEHKHKALAIDESCLRKAQRSFEVSMKVARPTSSPPGGRRSPSTGRGRPPAVVSAARQDGHDNEVHRQHKAVRMDHAAATKEVKSQAMREENRALIARCQKAVDEAAAKSAKALQERVKETDHVRQRLEGELRETTGKIDRTRHTMSETVSKIKSLKEPIDMTVACASHRRERTPREHVNDPVTVAIGEHKATLLRAKQELVGHHEAERGQLQSLNERRERLKEDLRDKTAALYIDLSCLAPDSGNRGGHRPLSVRSCR